MLERAHLFEEALDLLDAEDHRSLSGRRTRGKHSLPQGISSVTVNRNWAALAKSLKYVALLSVPLIGTRAPSQILPDPCAWSQSCGVVISTIDGGLTLGPA